MIELVILSLLLIGFFGSLASVFLVYVNGWRVSSSLTLGFTLLDLGAAITFSSVVSETTTKKIKVEQLKSGIIPVYTGDTLLIKTTHLKNDKDLLDNMWGMIG